MSRSRLHRPTITAHRGAMGEEPENTMRAFTRAVADSCDEVELDLQVTADGRLVVIHDHTVDRTTDGSGEVADLTLQQVRTLDAGHGSSVPTWDEVAQEIDVRIQAEIKATAAVPLLLESLRADPELEARVWVTSNAPEILLSVHEDMPQVRTGLIFLRTPDAEEILARSRAVHACAALCRRPGVTAEIVSTLHDEGLEVAAWPVPDAAALAEMVELGVDGITTDHPGAIRAAYDALGRA